MMSVEVVSKMYIPLVLVFCLCIGYILKKFMPTDNKIIPTVLFVIGMVCGVICLGVSFEAIVKGGVTGLAATGFHQMFKRLIEGSKKDDTKEFKMPAPADENKNINEEAIAENLKRAEVLSDGEEGTNNQHRH